MKFLGTNTVMLIRVLVRDLAKKSRFDINEINEVYHWKSNLNLKYDLIRYT